MGSVATKEAEISNTIQTNNNETQYPQFPGSPPVSPVRLAMLAEELEDPRSPGSFKRTPVHSPQLAKPSSTYKERVLNRLAQQSSSSDPRSPAALRTPLSKLGIPVVRTPPPMNLSMSNDPRSPYLKRTPLSLTGPVFVDDDVVVCDGAEHVEGAEQKTSSEGYASTPSHALRSGSMELSASPVIIALASSSPLDSPSLGRKRKGLPARRQTMSPLKKSFSAPMPDENSTPMQNAKSSTTTTPTTSTPTSANPSSLNAKARTPLSPLTNSRAMNAHCVPIQPIKFRMDPGILG